MWDFIGGYADNDLAVIYENRDELSKICDRILEGCRDTYIRNDAIVMKGEILHTGGKTAQFFLSKSIVVKIYFGKNDN